MLSRTLYDAGKPREAEAEARAALDLDPACAYAYLNLSYFARTAGKLDKATEHLEEGLSKLSETDMTRHDLATMHLNLGMLYAQRKDITRAEQNMLRSMEISPRAVAWYYTGQFYYDQRRFEDALRMFEMTLAHVPHWFAPIHIKLGLVYEGLSQPERARAEYEKYLEIAPPDARDREEVKRRLSQM